jgi:hypothetical protein
VTSYGGAAMMRFFSKSGRDVPLAFGTDTSRSARSGRFECIFLKRLPSIILSDTRSFLFLTLPLSSARCPNFETSFDITISMLVLT